MAIISSRREYFWKWADIAWPQTVRDVPEVVFLFVKDFIPEQILRNHSKTNSIKPNQEHQKLYHAYIVFITIFELLGPCSQKSCIH